MAEFIQVATIVRKLFIPEVLPWQHLIAEANLEKLRVRYAFRELNYQANNPTAGVAPQILAPKGEFILDAKVLILEQFVIEPMILQYQITGDSDQADKFTEDIAKFFLEIDPDKKYSDTQQLIQTYQTIAIAKLSFPADAMLSERFSRFLKEIATPRITPNNTQVDLRLFNLRLVVSYRPETPDFTYLPKVLAIEPRQGSRPSDMLYYTQSPTDFKTHKELVECLEKALS